MRRPYHLTQISAPLPPVRCVGRTGEPSPPASPSGPVHYVLIADEVIEASRARQAAMEDVVGWLLPICERASLTIAMFAVLVAATQLLVPLS